MAIKYICRRFEPGDETRLVSFHNHIFPFKSTANYWRWKYFENPAGQAISYIALYDDKIIGNIASVPARMKVEEREINVVQCCDISALDGFRKGTPFIRLSNLVIEEIERLNYPFLYAFSKDIPSQALSGLFKFRDLGACFKLVKIINPAYLLRRKFLDNFFFETVGDAAALGFKFFTRPPINSNKELEIKKVNYFDESFDELWRRLSGNFKIATVRDAAYLNWRYLDYPLHGYKVYAAYRGEKPEGFIVLSIRKEEIVPGFLMRKGFISDILVPPRDNELIEFLISNAVDYFYRNKADNISAWVPPGSEIYRILKERFWFLTRNIPRCMFIRSNNNDFTEQYLCDKTNWYLTFGDTDVY